MLEEHRRSCTAARVDAEEILAEARKTADAMERRMREETEVERQRRLEETRREIAAETARALEQIRSEVADLTLEATSIVVGKKLDSDRDRGADRRRDRLARLLAAGGPDIAAAHRIYAEALFEAAQEKDRLAQVHEALSDFAIAIEQTPELRNVLRNPQIESTAKASILSDLAGGDEPLFTNFLRLVAEKGRAGEMEQIADEFERLMAREERRLTVELTTARELTDDEAKAIVAQIEKAAGRTVEATRSVDPDLIGGVVLQAGSYRADASVRGRLERLRQTLVRS